MENQTLNLISGKVIEQSDKKLIGAPTHLVKVVGTHQDENGRTIEEYSIEPYPLVHDGDEKLTDYEAYDISKISENLANKYRNSYTPFKQDGNTYVQSDERVYHMSSNLDKIKERFNYEKPQNISEPVQPNSEEIINLVSWRLIDDEDKKIIGIPSHLVRIIGTHQDNYGNRVEEYSIEPYPLVYKGNESLSEIEAIELDKLNSDLVNKYSSSYVPFEKYGNNYIQSEARIYHMSSRR